MSCRNAYGDGGDLMMALARKIVSGEEHEAKTVEDVLAAAEELLAGEGWKLVEVNGNGKHVNGIGLTVELALDQRPSRQRQWFAFRRPGCQPLQRKRGNAAGRDEP